MFVYETITGRSIPEGKEWSVNEEGLYFIHCNPSQVEKLQPIFDFDPGTLIDCMNFDESIRMNSYPEYDFISMIYFKLIGSEICLSEINMYVGKNYIVLISSDTDNVSADLLEKIKIRIKEVSFEKQQMNKLYYLIFDILLTDLSDTMEQVEDEINLIERKIIGNFAKSYLQLIADIRSNTYMIKKQLRPLLYIGDQLIVNDNQLIEKDNMRYFKNIDTRINKIYDFSLSLQEYANELLHIYESQMSTYTNNIINKLTILTLFFGPLTVITGIYGMNFTNMPELQWSFGYPMAISSMVIVSLIIYIILKIKKWL